MAAELAIIAKLQDEASSGIRALRGEVEGLGDSGGIAAKGFQSLQTVGVAAIAAVGAAAVAAGVALAGFVSGAIEKAAALEAQMDTVAALLGATAEQAELLRQATLDLALDPQLKVSATEAAQAIEMLAQNGLTVEQILGGAARATVLLANATGADFTVAARIATDAMALWGMEADQLGQVADGVTAVLVQSKFEVNDYALALAQAGGVAAAVGVSFDDFNATLVAIAPYFASGSDAGTSYKTMLQRLIPTTTAAKDAMAALGLITADGANAFFDSQGNMRDMAEVAGLLHGALSGLSEQQRLQALSTIFGTDAMRAAAAMSQFTEEQFTNLMAVMANTSAAEIAAQRMENFSGAMDILKGVIEGLQLMLGNVLLPILTKLALEGANLLAAWGPPVIGVFQSFMDNLNEGMSVIDAFIEAIWDIAPQPVLDALVAFRDGILPIIQNVGSAITAFVSWKDVLGALGIAIASVVVPALIAIAQFVAPIVAVFAGLVLAIAALRNAFETNFLGIRDLAESLWGSLQGVFEGIKALLSGDTTAAMAAFRSAWETGWNAIVGFIQSAGGQIGAALAGLWQSITAWFQGIDWGALGQSLVEKFLAGMAALGQAAAGSWEWLLTSLTNFIQSVDWGQLGYTLIDLLIKGIVGAIGLIGTALAGLVTFIWNFITGTNWIELGVNLVSAIIEGLKSFGEGAGAALAEWRQVIFDWAGAEDWSGVAEHIAGMVGEALGEMADAVVSQLSEWQAAIFDWAGAEDWSGVAEHIAEMVGEALGEMAEAITGQLSEWQTAIFDWAGAEDWSGVAEHIAEMVGEALGEMAEAITGQLSEWQVAIFDWAGAEDWSGVAEHIAEMVGEALGEMAEAITGQLSEWQVAIFDWAGAEDWSGVAEHIAEMVGEAMGGASDSVISTLGDWEKAIFDWAGAEDWGGVAEEIAVAVGDSLVEVSDKVTEKLSGWIQAFTDWVGTVDWYQIGYDIMFAITDAFLDFKTMITEKIGTWLGDTKTATEGYAWYEVGAYILLEIAKSAAGLVSDWTAAVGAWVSNIGSAIQQHMANLAQVGADIVGGIVAGINAAADLIRGAIAGAAGASVPAAADAVGAQSPARKLIPVGMDISAGIAVGITQGAGTIISAINGVAGATELEAVKAFSEAVKAIGEAIQSAVLSFVLLNGFGGANTGGAAAGLASIVLLMKSIVDAFAEANSHSAEALDEVGKFADVAGALVGLIAESLLPMRILSAIDLSFLGSANLGAGLAAMRDFLIAAVAAFADAAAELGVMGQLVEAFTSAAEGVIGLVEDGLRAAALLAGFNFGAVVQGWHLQQQIIIFRNIVATMVREFADAALELAFMSEGVQLFTEAAEGVIELVEDGLHATMLLSGFNFGAAVQGWHLQQQIITFRNIVATMVREFADAALELGYMGESVEAFTGAAEGVIGLVEDGLHATMLLSGFNFGAAVQGWHLQQQIIIFRNIVRTMVREFAEAALEFGSMADSVSAFADAAEGVIGLVEDGLSAAVALSEIDFGPVVNGWHLATQIETFRNIIRTMIREFSEAATEFGSMADSVEAFADAADAVLGLVIEGIAAVSALSETDFGAIVQGWHLATQIETFRNIIRTMMREFSEAATEFGSMADSVEAFADAAGAVVDLVEPAIEAIGLLANYAPDAAGLSAAMQQFVADLMALTLALATGFQQVAAQIGEGVGAAAEFAGDAEDIVDVVEPGIEALAALAGYVSATGVAAAVGLFAADLVTIVEALGTAFAAASVEMGTAAGQAAEFAGDAEDIVDVVEPGIEALAALAGYVSATGVAAAVGLFAADLVTIVRALGTAFAAASVEMGDAAARAAEFAGDAEDIVGVVEPGIEALAALATYAPMAGLPAAVNGFAADLAAVVIALGAALAEAATQIGTATAQASTFAEKAKAILDVVGPGIDALAALATYAPVAGLKTTAQGFAADLVMVIGTIANGLAESGLAADQAVVEAGKVSGSLKQVLDVVKPGVDALVALAEYTSGKDLQAKAQQFTDDLVAVTQTLTTGLTQSALAADGALTQAGSIADSIKQLFDVIKPALEALEALAAYSASKNLQAKAQQFTDDLVAVASTLVTGLNSAAAQLGQEAITAARDFAGAVTSIVGEVNTAMTGLVALGDIKTPSIESALAYIVQSSGQIVTSFVAAGDIGAAVGYAAAFRENLTQLVAEVQMAVAQLAALAGSGTSGSVQGALTAIATSLMNTEGQFAGAGTALAGALIAAMQTGIAAGLGAVMGAVVAVLGTTEAAGLNEANDFSAVGDAITEATADGVDGGQSQVIAAVVQVVAAAIAAGLNEAKKAGEIGEEVIRAVLGEMSSNRSSLDQAGASSGEALIDGMVRAIAAGKSRLVNAIKDAVTAAVAAAKAALGIASPSKVAFALMDNFMQTAAGRLGRGDELAAAVGRSIDAAMGAAAARLAGAKLAAPVAVNAGLARTPVMPSVLPRPATAGAGPERSFGGGAINIYGNIVLPNVGNPVSFLEELDALRGGGR